MNSIIIDYLEQQIVFYTLEAERTYENYLYYNRDKILRYKLYACLQNRSDYKKALKEYKKLFES